MSLYKKTLKKNLKNDYQFFDTLKIKDLKIRGILKFVNKSQIS